MADSAVQGGVCAIERQFKSENSLNAAADGLITFYTLDFYSPERTGCKKIIN